MRQVGIVTMDGRQVGVVTQSSDFEDTFTPDLSGYEPTGRAARGPIDGGHGGGHGGGGYGDHPPAPAKRYRHHAPGHPTGKDGDKGYVGHPRGDTGGGRPVRKGSQEVDKAIVEASKAHHLDPDTMRAVASIESDMDPSSNADKRTQYKGLYQIGRDEWRRFGSGNIYDPHDNAMAAARMFEANRDQFREHYHREPTDSELYMMHQQGLGFYTRNAMTNIGGNPYPGMHGDQTHESFEAGWGRELARRKDGLAGRQTAREDASGAPPEILAQARNVALAQGGAGVRKFMAENGYPMNGNWCGEFAADVVKSVGGQPPKNPEVASNWRNWGTPVEAPQPGDIAIRRGAATGSTGSHVTIVEGSDAKTFKGIGGNQGRWERTFPRDQYDFRRGSTPAPAKTAEKTFNPETDPL